MRSPFSPFTFLLFLFLLGLLLAFIQIEALKIAFDKLGLSESSAFLLLFGSLFGSAVNLPLFSIKAEMPKEETIPPPMRGLLRQQMMQFKGRTLIAVNVGGCLIPLTFSLYLVTHNPISAGSLIVAIALVSVVCYLASRPMPGLGVGMPIFIAPITAAIVAILVDHTHAAPLAYVCGTLGVLIGADIMRLRDIRRLGTPMASIGGAGTFDGIFLTGIVAVLLA
jgi:uncharacterized membrane protein